MPTLRWSAEDLVKQQCGRVSAARVQGPEATLKALRILQSKVQDLEAELVGQARRDGISWDRIGRALKLPGNSIRRRYAEVVEAPARVERPTKRAIVMSRRPAVTSLDDALAEVARLVGEAS